jgi:signal transduction histidine kinase/CheY-like chemotaxis protein
MRLRTKLLLPIGAALLGTLVLHLWAHALRSGLAQEHLAHVAITQEQVEGALATEVALEATTRAYRALLLADEDDRAERHAEFLSFEAQVRRRSRALAETADDPALRALVERFRDQHRAVSVAYREALDALGDRQDPSALRQAEARVRPVEGAPRATFAAVLEHLDIAQEAKRGDDAWLASLTELGIAGASLLLSVGIGVALLLLIRRLVTAPAEEATLLAARLARGEALDEVQVVPDDELGDLCRSLVDLHGALEAERQRTANTLADLRHARFEAEAAAEAKQTFLDNITHELRTPLHGVLGTMELLGQELTGPDQRELAEAATRSARNLVDMVEDLLELTQVSGGSLILEARPVDLGSLLQEAVVAARARPEARGIRIDFEAPPERPTRVLADRARLRRVVDELLGNAVRHAGGDDIEVSLSAERAGDRIQVEVEILDAGCGIPEDHAERVFEPFTQVEEGRARRAGGAGVGLALARRLVLHMGGQLLYRPRPGGGSAFSIRLELAADGTISQDDGSLADDLEPPAQPAAQVLLFDENPVSRVVGARILDELGVTAHVADAVDAAEAHLETSALAVAVVVHGWDQPGMLERLRQAADRGGHLTALVAVASADRAPALREAGWDDVIEGPLTAEGVIRLRGTWLFDTDQRTG